MSAKDLVLTAFTIAISIGLIITMFYTAAILAPILAVGFLSLLLYSFISDASKKKQKKKRKGRTK